MNKLLKMQDIPQQTTNYFPSLADNKFSRYFNFIVLYFAQGVPEGMLTFGIPAWMAMNGKSAGEVAGFAVITVLPWSLKFLVAPMMDRYTYLPMGRKRPWVLIGQLGLVLSCIGMAYVPDPLNNLKYLMLAGVIVSSFGAFQDVATDGMAIDVIPEEQQAKANGFMWGAKIVGISSSLAIVSWLLNKYNFTFAILSMSVVIALIMLVPLFTRERPGEKLTPWSSGEASTQNKKLQVNDWSSIFKSLFLVFNLKNSLLIAFILFTFQGGFKYIATLLPIFTVKELNWTNLDYSQSYSTAKLIGGLTGMILGGILMDKFGKKVMLNVYTIILVTLVAGFSFFKMIWSSVTFIYGFMLIYNILYTLICISLFAIAMQFCWKKVSASQFTLYMTIANIGQIAIGSLIGPIKAHFTWQVSIFIAAAILLVASLALQFLNINQQIQKVADLENSDLEKDRLLINIRA